MQSTEPSKSMKKPTIQQVEDKLNDVEAKFENKIAEKEIMGAFFERANRRLWIALLITIILLVLSNGLWIYRETQFEDVTVTQEVEQDADNGENHFIGGDNYGTASHQN